MKRLTMMMVLPLLAACDSPTSDRAEAGEVAIRCVDQMVACEDWAPLKMGDGASTVPLEDCTDKKDATDDDYDYTDSSDNKYACNRRNERREERNYKIESRPSSRSPCQQKVDACARMVEALVGNPETIHYHEK